MPKRDSKKDEALLKRIRDRFRLWTDAWEDARAEAVLNMRCLSVNGPWDPTELQERKKAFRPRPHHDQITQHRNKLNNEVRLNKRAIEVAPEGVAGDDDTASLTGNRIRQIEYDSNAQTAYSAVFDGMTGRGYGFLRISKCYMDDDSPNMTLRIKPIENPESVTIDPFAEDYYDPDGIKSARGCYVANRVPKDEFLKKYPNAQIRDFSPELRDLAPQWLMENDVLLAEYWEVDGKPRLKLWLEDPSDPAGRPFYQDELEAGAKIKGSVLRLKDGSEFKILKTRECEERTVTKYITNGVEILEEEPWEGKWIGIIPGFGLREWVPQEGGGTKLSIKSLITMARSPQMSYDFALACEEEEMGMTSKTPYWMYEGQQEGHETELNTMHKVPRPYQLIKPVVDGATGQVLPFPQTVNRTAQIEGYELAKAAFSRAIEAALGSASVEHKDKVAQSGKALNAIQSETSLGSYHFIDNFDRVIQFAGRQLDDLLPKVEDTDREVGIRTAAGEYSKVRVNGPSEDEKGNPVFRQYAKTDEEGNVLPGKRHNVTITVGPAHPSERDKVRETVQGLISDLPPEMAAGIYPDFIELLDLGPIGKEIVEKLRGGQDGEAVKQELMQAKQALAEMQQALQQLQFEKQAKIVEKQGNLEVQEKKNEGAARQAQVDADASIRQKQAEGQVEIDLKHIEAQLEQSIARFENQAKLQQIEVDRKFDILLEHMKEMAAMRQQTRQIEAADRQQDNQLTAAAYQQDREIESRPAPEK